MVFAFKKDEKQIIRFYSSPTVSLRTRLAIHTLDNEDLAVVQKEENKS